MKITKKHLFAGLVSAFVLTMAFSFTALGVGDVYAQVNSGDPFGLQTVTDPTRNNQPVSEGTSPISIANQVIGFALGFLGIIAVAIILYAGFLWMTAGGADEKVETAKKMLMQGVIGLIIIMAAWGIAGWVLNAIFETVGQAR